MFSKLKQFKDIRDKAKTIQSALAQERIEGSAGWGKLKVIMDGNQRIVDVSIDPELVGDKGKLENLVKEAVNDAIEKVQKVMASKLKDLGGLDLAEEMKGMMGNNNE
jgi:DNA-binding YbaB/EbfC family protein